MGIQIYDVRAGDKEIDNEVLAKIRDVYSCSVKEGRLLYKLASECTGKGVIVEIGSWKGYSTIWIASGSKAGNHVDVYAIDTFAGDKLHYGKGEAETYREFMQNITEAKVRDIITPMCMSSEIAAKSWDDKPIEFIFIDGDHEDVYADFLRWYPHIVDGGIVALHDTVAWPSMIPYKVAINELYKGNDFREVKQVGSITYATKISRCCTFWERDKKRDAICRRYLYQALIPYWTKSKIIGGKILGRG